MRVSIVNGNGCMCDKCRELLLPKQAIKLKSFVLDSDPKKARTGLYRVMETVDLCSNCYKKLTDYLKN